MSVHIVDDEQRRDRPESNPGLTAGPIHCRRFGPQNRCFKAPQKLSRARNYPSLRHYF